MYMHASKQASKQACMHTIFTDALENPDAADAMDTASTFAPFEN